MNAFQKLYALLKLREAVNQSDKAHARNGERYYVMPTSGVSGKLVIVDRANFRKLKHKGYINNKKANMGDLEIECFYHTPYRNGTGEIAPDSIAAKRRQYFSWCEAVKKLKKAKRNEAVRRKK